MGDMTTLHFEPHSFDAVIAFYSITHVPRDEHPAPLGKIAAWLNPGGCFLASLGFGDSPDWMGEWLGTRMFFSHFDAATNRRFVEQAGLKLERAEIVAEEENGETVRFLWVLASRPST